MAERDDDGAHLSPVGAFIREQRRLVRLSQRQLAKATGLSDTYLSQLERGLHEPSVRAMRAIAKGLNVSAEQLISLTGAFEAEPDIDGDTTADRPAAAEATTQGGTEEAIRSDVRLTEAQRAALLAVLASYLEANTASGAVVSGGPDAPAGPRRRGSR